jgi:hypothetical protein
MKKLSNTTFLNRDLHAKKRALLASNAFFNKYKKNIFLVWFGLHFIVLLFTWPSPHLVLIIEEAKTDKILWKEETKPGDWFEYHYIHSVELSQVIEKYKLDHQGTILAMESWTGSFGAGLPYELSDNIEFIDGFYVVKDINRSIDQINFLPSDLNPAIFNFKEHKVVLSEPPYARKHLRIEVRSLTWLKWIIDYK